MRLVRAREVLCLWVRSCVYYVLAGFTFISRAALNRAALFVGMFLLRVELVGAFALFIS